MSGRVLVLRHHAEDSPGLVGDALVERGYRVDAVMMDEHNPSPSVVGYDLLVVLGSKHAVYDEAVEALWFGRELEVLAEADRLGVPIFGICFGAQALCRHFGGVVAPAPEPEIGWFEVSEVNASGVAPGPWFEYHFDRCTLPASAEVWAETARAVQAFAIGRNVGVQFHPEIDEVQLAAWMVAGGEEETRDLGLDPAGLLAQTARETPAARRRVGDLVDLVLRRVAV